MSDPDAENLFLKMFVSYPLRMEEWDRNSPQTQDILLKFKPRIYIAPDSHRPINFYQDYLPHCVIRSVRETGKIVEQHVDREMLNRLQFDTDLYLDYQIPVERSLQYEETQTTPTFYGRVFFDTIHSEGRSIPLLFLKYSLVFPYSGLPVDIGFIRKLGSSLIGDSKGWHELDIHGAIHIILHGRTKRPMGVLLAQHNHHRVFLVERDIKWPSDNRVEISIAQYSNEPYLMPQGRAIVYERTIGNPMHVAYLFGVTDDAPITSGQDKIYSKSAGAREVSMILETLPPDDGLYTAWMSLGDRKKIFRIWESWYMRGPPGMDFYTFGPLKNLGDLSSFWFIDPEDKIFFNLFAENMVSLNDMNFKPILDHQMKRFSRALSTIH